MMELDVEKGLIPAHDIVGACSNCGLQEFVIIRISENGTGLTISERSSITLRTELSTSICRSLANSSRTRRYSSKMGSDIARRKRCSCHALRISNGGPFQNTPEMRTFVSRIALIFTLCDGGLWQLQTSDPPS